MQNYCKTIGALAAASALVAGTAKAEIEASFNAGVHNEYIWRGVQLGDDMLTAGLDFATEAYDLSLSAGIWHASFDVAGTQTTETDIYGEVAKDLGFATAAIGYIWYVNDGFSSSLVDDAQEIYFGLSREIAGIDASLTYYWDIETDNGGYAELGLGKSFDLSDCLSLGIGVAQGFGVEEGDLANLVTTVSLDYAVTENATLSPYVLYAVEGSEDVHWNNGNTQEFVGGLNFFYNF